MVMQISVNTTQISITRFLTIASRANFESFSKNLETYANVVAPENHSVDRILEFINKTKPVECMVMSLRRVIKDALLRGGSM